MMRIPKGTKLYAPDGAQGYEVEKDLLPGEAVMASHMKAFGGALKPEAGFSQSELDELKEKCPGIIEHMPPDKGDVRPEGTVPGDPVADAERREQPSGHPSNDGIDKPTLHPSGDKTTKDEVKK